jgi:hypothetical protein
VVTADQPTQTVSSHTIGSGGFVLVYGNTFAQLPLHAAAAVNIAEQQVAAFFDPHGSLSWAVRAAETTTSPLVLLRAMIASSRCDISIDRRFQCNSFRPPQTFFDTPSNRTTNQGACSAVSLTAGVGA